MSMSGHGTTHCVFFLLVLFFHLKVYFDLFMHLLAHEIILQGLLRLACDLHELADFKMNSKFTRRILPLLTSYN